jgi:hypothetical protein
MSIRDQIDVLRHSDESDLVASETLYDAPRRHLLDFSSGGLSWGEPFVLRFFSNPWLCRSTRTPAARRQSDRGATTWRI